MSKIVGCFKFSNDAELFDRIQKINGITEIDVIEIRLDCIPAEKIVNGETLLQKIKNIAEKPLILTIRDITEGGFNRYSVDDRSALFQIALKVGFEFLDIELSNYHKFERKMPKNMYPSQLILSWHGEVENFDDSLISNEKLSSFESRTIIKLVFECNSTDQMIITEAFQLRTISNNPNNKWTIFGMGKYSNNSRIQGRFYGNELTYVAVNSTSTISPSQLTLEKFTVLAKIYQSMNIGTLFKVQGYGTSHGPRIGCIVSGFPKNTLLNLSLIGTLLKLRQPAQSPISSPRNETDDFLIKVGVENSQGSNVISIGSPMMFVIHNKDFRSSDYSQFQSIPRPSHVDYPARMRFGNKIELEGSGIFSGRLTAPFLIGGALALQLLNSYGIKISAYTCQIGSIIDKRSYSTDEIALQRIKNPVRSVDPDLTEKMIETIEEVAEEKDSIGGKIAVVIENLAPGIGDPWFNSLESQLSKVIFGIPGVRGIEFGAGFDAISMKGSNHNDPYLIKNEKITTKTNHSGGIVGGISIGTDVRFQVAIKPPASIGKPQKTLNISTRKMEFLEISGRHDPCIVPRIIPVMEAITAIVVYNQLLEQQKI